MLSELSGATDTNANIRGRFDELAAWWREATQFLSSPTEIAQHAAYQRIIAMGSSVVPLILEDLRDNGGDWYIALRRLVSDPPFISQETARSTRRVIDTWLEWGRQHGYLRFKALPQGTAEPHGQGE